MRKFMVVLPGKNIGSINEVAVDRVLKTKWPY